MSQSAETKPGGMKTWLRVVLGASLALNLLIVGMIGGALVMRGKWHQHNPPRLDGIVGPLTRALTPQDRRAIGREMRQTNRSTRATRARLGEEFAALVTDLRAEPFDPEAVRTRLAGHRSIFSDRLELGHTLLLERLAGMTGPERAAFANRLQDEIDRRRAKHDEKKRD